eukprot:EC725466.1.p3 GENE.EC725466.1~~EC725466.1.p3  ORF type:complete len:102 (+),score=18.05 EC725466.1:319-624(+)
MLNARMMHYRHFLNLVRRLELLSSIDRLFEANVADQKLRREIKIGRFKEGEALQQKLEAVLERKNKLVKRKGKSAADDDDVDELTREETLLLVTQAALACS